jgi:predicted RNase H-like HicB family nuclease
MNTNSKVQMDQQHLEDILPAIEDAKRLWLELALERVRPIPEPERQVQH